MGRCFRRWGGISKGSKAINILVLVGKRGKALWH